MKLEDKQTTMITKTERRYWQNGYQIRGGWHRTYALSIGRIAILVAWTMPYKLLGISLFFLTGPSVDEVKRQREMGIPTLIIQDHYLSETHKKLI